MKVGIVGGGLFGSIIADELTSLGAQVSVFDANYEFAGSKPAACLMKPSWFSSLGPEMYDPALKLLDRLYGIQDIPFYTGLGITAKVHWVNPKKIMPWPSKRRYEFVQGEVVHVGRDTKNINFKVNGQTETRFFDLIVVAAGVWTQKLIAEAEQKALRGVSFYFSGQTDPAINVWAPYKQLVKFNISENEVWCGDGSAILRQNFDNARLEQSLDRAKRFNGGENPRYHIIGDRPYVKGKGLVQEVSPKVWVASGGAKNGTLLAAWAAHTIGRAMQ